MSKPRLVPLYFEPGRDDGFDVQLTNLQRLLADDAELLAPVPLGAALPDCDAVIFPQFLGEGYRRVADFRAIDRPILVITSEFGTMSMWDWELISYLRSEGVDTIAPYDIEQTRKVCAALRVRRDLRNAKFVVYQDNPGKGAQAPIFKRFYWWEDECTQRIFAKFGVSIEKRSYRALGQAAMAIPDSEAEAALATKQFGCNGAKGKPVTSAGKMYLALKRELDADPDIQGLGINCLNESHFSDTTPCLAFNLLYQERQLIWGCEGDTMSMLSKYLLHKSLGVPIFMTNLYPFLMGQAALKHERISHFPEVEDEPENHILIAHCGYMGVIPQSFATDWTLRKKVLAIVNDNATAIDARFPTGPTTLAKLHPTLDRITVAESTLKGYVQYPDSDCVNGGLVKVRDGHRLMNSLASHHYLVMQGHNLNDINMIAKVFNMEVDAI